MIKAKAKEIRKNIIQILVPHESHHIGCALGIVDILAALYFQIMRVNPQNPKDSSRDIFILSKGHAASALYATLMHRGFFSEELLATYDRDGGSMPEHASTTVPGVEVSTGSLGHGLPIGAGFALSFKNDNQDNRVFTLLSDGELNEGSNWEAFMFAAHHNLSNLIAIIDMNGFQGYAPTEKVINLFPVSVKLKSFNWNVYEVDGHNPEQLIAVFNTIQKNQNRKPHCILAKTIKGKGASYFEGKFESHYKSLDAATKQLLLTELSS